MFGDGTAGGILGGSLGSVLPSDMPEGFEDLDGGQPMMQAAAGVGQVPPGAPTRRVMRRPGPPVMAGQQMQGMPPMGQTGPSKGGLVAAFLGGVIVCGVGYGAYRYFRG